MSDMAVNELMARFIGIIPDSDMAAVKEQVLI